MSHDIPSFLGSQKGAFVAHARHDGEGLATGTIDDQGKTIPAEA